MTNEILKLRKNVVVWNVLYVVINCIPIFALIGTIIWFGTNAGNNFAKYTASEAANITFALIGLIVVPLIFIQFFQYKKNMAKINFNDAFSKLLVEYVNNKNYDINLNSNENKLNNASKIQQIGFAKMSKYVSTVGYFSGDYNKLSVNGAYVHTFFKMGSNSLVNKILGTKMLGSDYFNTKMKNYYYSHFAGVIAEIDNINFKYDPIVIYDKKYKNKNYMYQFDNNSKVKTGNKEFDSKYEIMSANPVKAKEYLSEDIMKAILETATINRPHGFHFIGKSLCIAIQTKDLVFNFSTFKKFNLENELENMKVNIEAYNKLLNVL